MRFFAIFVLLAVALFGCISADKPALCALPAATGHCKAAIPKFFHNSETKKCESFTYGGCGGNDNRFNTKEECEAKCA